MDMVSCKAASIPGDQSSDLQAPVVLGWMFDEPREVWMGLKLVVS